MIKTLRALSFYLVELPVAEEVRVPIRRVQQLLLKRWNRDGTHWRLPPTS